MKLRAFTDLVRVHVEAALRAHGAPEPTRDEWGGECDGWTVHRGIGRVMIGSRRNGWLTWRARDRAWDVGTGRLPHSPRFTGRGWPERAARWAAEVTLALYLAMRIGRAEMDPLYRHPLMRRALAEAGPRREAPAPVPGGEEGA